MTTDIIKCTNWQYRCTITSDISVDFFIDFDTLHK